MEKSRLAEFGIPARSVFIGGAWIAASSPETREIRSPFDDRLVEVVAYGGIDDAERAVVAARAAQPQWARTSAIARAEHLRALSREIDVHAEFLAQSLTAEGGKLIAESRIDVAFASKLLMYAAESATRLEGEILPADAADEQVWIQRVPYGVVAAMTAWNFPAALFARKVGPALVTGNTVVLKPHEVTPVTTLLLAELVRRAGIPAGVVNVVLGDGRSVGAHLVSHRETDLVSLTGSVRAGEEVYALGARQLKPVRLELGGKAPFIVMQDADIGRAVDAAIASKFFAGGSVCTCNDRMYIHEKVYDQFLERFVQKVQALKVGDPLGAVDVGPRVTREEVKKLEEIVTVAQQQGARLLYRYQAASDVFSRGNWSFPAVLETQSNDLEIMKKETFGPVIAAMKVSDFEQALAYANDSEYGLSAYLFAQNHRHIMQAVQRLNFGEVYVNRASGEGTQGFHTGYRKSGLGGEDGKHGIEGFLRKKTLYVNYAE